MQLDSLDLLIKNGNNAFEIHSYGFEQCPTCEAICFHLLLLFVTVLCMLLYWVSIVYL